MPKSVLIVDDIPFVRKTLSKILTDAHYEVIGEATNGREAIEKYFKLRPDIITMDVVMPQITGIEAARRILKKDKDAKIIMISAMNQENLIMEAINAGAKDYILKPFDPQQILSAIDHILKASGALERS